MKIKDHLKIGQKSPKLRNGGLDRLKSNKKM